jgi:hypothetical protein
MPETQFLGETIHHLSLLVLLTLQQPLLLPLDLQQTEQGICVNFLPRILIEF